MISLVIIHWNTPEELKKSLGLLTKGSNMEIIVVDNNSDISVSWIQKDFPTVRLIQNDVNRGFGFACNQGVQASKGEWVVFLNPDVFITAEAMRKVIEHAEENDLDAVSPLPNSDNYKKPVPTPLTFLTEFTPLVRLLPTGFMWKVVDRFTLFGGCVGIKRKVIEALGGWDERYFVWYEDVDLTKQLLDNKYKIGWAKVDFDHKGGSSFHSMETQEKRNLFFNEMDVYTDKNFGFFGRVVTRFIRKRFNVSKFLPGLQEGVSLTIPNIKKELLDNFLERNEEYLHNVEHVIIVTSDIKPKEVWGYRKKHPRYRFVLLTQNRGFAHTVNVGLRVSPTKWLGTVNDDVVLNPTWLTSSLQNPPSDAGSLNPIIYAENKTVESAGISVLLKGKANPLKRIPAKTYAQTDATNGAAVIYKNAALQKTGLFDERFGSYLEDVDLSLRLRRNGFINYVCSKAHITHLGHSSSSSLGKKKPWYDFRNWILVIIKNWSFSSLIRYFPDIFVERLRNISGIIKS